jgi:hypothetical protein
MRKNATTIQPKPAVDEAALQAFIGADNQNKAAAPALAVVKPASLQASQQAGQPASQLAEATAMLSVRIPASLHRDLRVHSVTVGMPIQDIVTELLSTYLASQQPQA